MADMKGRDFLSAGDLSREELAAVLDLATDAKAEPDRLRGSLAGRTMALLFEKPSLRTKSSFLVAAWRLGLDAAYFGREEVDLGKRETIADGARVLSRYFDVLVHRTHAHERVVELARWADVPVVNALSDHEHPCQAVGDLLTVRERLGHLDGLTLAWIGDGNNVCHSLSLACALAGMDVRIASPEGYRPSQEVLDHARRLGGSVELVDSPADAVEGAHVVTTDTWVSMGQEEEKARRRAVFESYRVDGALMARADADAVFLHCLPAHRGEEVTDEVMDGPASAVFDQAENRLHAQLALVAKLV